jgi:hypothetical protein
VVLALTWALPGLGVFAQPRPPLTREQAIEGLAKPDVESRRDGAAWLGEVGVMADVPALVRSLRDRDDVVRALAVEYLLMVLLG